MMPPLGKILREFDTLSQASVALAQAVAEQLRAAVAARGEALMAVPGGSTPRRFLEELARQDVPWEHVTVMPTDERLVAADDPQSNARMIRACLAPVADGRATYLSFHAAAAGPGMAAGSLSDRLAGMPALDVLVSGMGEDGHIASLFPEDASWRQSSAAAQVVPGHPDGLVSRLSLSPARLQAAKWSALLIAGQAKHKLLQAVVAGHQTLPVALLLDKAQPASVFWGQDAQR
jgi:6-phosphogluconolactonase